MEAMSRFSRSIGASPGRSGHTLSIDAGRTLVDTREAIAGLFGVTDPRKVVFTKNATEALNIVILSLLKGGGHAVISGMEHNSVMRPLNAARASGANYSVAPCSGTGELDPRDLVPLIRSDTRLIVITHVSNVTGAIMPVAEAADIARERGIPLCVDAAQSAGVVPVDMEAMNIGLLAFTGHKNLYGPQGTGGLIITQGLERTIGPLMHGGTGSRSEFEEQPDFLPDKYESGTPNTVGIAGLRAGVGFIAEAGMDAVSARERAVTARLLEGLKSIRGVRIYGPEDPLRQTALVSFTVEGMSPSEVSFALDEEYGIMSRPGLQCAPSAHRTIGTFPEGTVRFSPGFFTTSEEVDYAVEAVAALASGRKKGARR